MVQLTDVFCTYCLGLMGSSTWDSIIRDSVNRRAMYRFTVKKIWHVWCGKGHNHTLKFIISLFLLLGGDSSKKTFYWLISGFFRELNVFIWKWYFIQFYGFHFFVLKNLYSRLKTTRIKKNMKNENFSELRTNFP